MTVNYVQSISTRSGTTSHKGFIAHYRTECFGINLFGLTGSLESPNYPSPVYADRSCEWTIRTTLGSLIVLVFTHLQVDSSSAECQDNYVEFSSPLLNSPPVVLCSGQRELDVAARFNTTVKHSRWVMPTNEAKIVFKATEGYADNKFRLEWMTKGCGDFFVDTQSPGFGVSRNDTVVNFNQVECQYTINAPFGKKVRLFIYKFSLVSPLQTICQYKPEFSYETIGVHVFAGLNNVTGAPVQSYCGSDADVNNTVQIESGFNQMFIVVRFIPSNMNAKADYYFLANYTTTDGGCGTNLSGFSGALHSPNFPQSYNPGDTCSWQITVPNGFLAVLTLNHLYIGNSLGVCRNYYLFEGSLSVYDGTDAGAPLLVRHCGNKLPDVPVIKASGNKMFVQFTGVKANSHSIDTRSSRGFNASYSAGENINLCGINAG